MGRRFAKPLRSFLSFLDSYHTIVNEDTRPVIRSPSTTLFRILLWSLYYIEDSFQSIHFSWLVELAAQDPTEAKHWGVPG